MPLIVPTPLALLVALWAVSAALAAGASYRLEVDGLACPFCAYGIEKELSALEGVERIDTNIEAGTVTVTMRDGATLDKDTAREAVTRAGFTLGGFEELAQAAENGG